jgi:hypothetical protein
MAGAAPACAAPVRGRAPVAASHRFAGTCGPRAGQTLDEAVKEKRMKSFAKAVLAAVAAGGLLAGCATYDYGYGYTYSQPYSYGYDYGYGGPYTYGYSPYYYDYGPSYYVGPSVGFGFTYRDRDHRDYRNRRSYSRNDNRQRSTDYRRGNDRRGDRASRGNATRPPVTQRNVAPAHTRARPVARPPTQASNVPYGGTNKPFSARNSQQ